MDGEDATVQPAMFARRSPRLVVATGQQLEAVEGRADLRDLTPPWVPRSSTSRSWSPRDAAPGSRALAKRSRLAPRGKVGRSLISDEGLRPPSRGRRPGSSDRPGPRRSRRRSSRGAAQRAVGHARRRRRLRLDGLRRRQRVADGPPRRRGPDRAVASCPTTRGSACGSSPSTRVARARTGASSSPSAASTTCASAAPSATPSVSAPPSCRRLTGGGTGLYDTALAAYRTALRNYDPHYSNAVVLMTDGRNEDPGSISLDSC